MKPLEKNDTAAATLEADLNHIIADGLRALDELDKARHPLAPMLINILGPSAKNETTRRHETDRRPHD